MPNYSAAFNENEQQALLKIGGAYKAKTTAEEIIASKPSPGFMKFLKSSTSTVKAKRMVVNGKTITTYVAVSTKSTSLFCKVCGVPIGVVAVLVALFFLDYIQQMPPVRMSGDCDVVPQFRMPPEERPVFQDCEWCEENCAECIACYDAKSVWYEDDMDRCGRIGGPCGYPFGSLDHCTQTCGPVMVKGKEGLHCVAAAVEFSDYFTGPDFCEARDPSAPTVYGVDPVGVLNGRLPPNIYLPEGYNDDANADKKWPLLVAFTGRESCGNFFYWYTGLRPIAYEKGFLVVFPDAVDGAWCGPIDTAFASTLAPHCFSEESGYQDDAAYAASLIAEIQRDYRVAEIFTFGWSNGAAFSMMMACYFSDIITGSVAYAGGDGHLYTIDDHPTYSRGCTGLDAPIHLLLVHDPIDPVVTYSNAAHNLEDFATWNGCASAGCPENVGTMDLMPLAKGWQSWVPNLIKYLEPGQSNRHRIVANETISWRFHGEGHSCSHGGSAELWTLDTWGSDTNWYMQGHASLWGDVEVPGVGHMNAFGHANDVHEHHALARRLLEWCLGMAYLNSLPADADPTEGDEDWQHGHTGDTDRRRLSTAGPGILKPPMTKERYSDGFKGQSMNRRQMPMFTVKSLEGHVHEECPHWAAQKHQMAHNIYTVVAFMAAPFVVLLMCCVADLCLCVSWVRQHNMYKKYLKQEKKRKLEEAKAASMMGAAPTKMGRVGAIGKQPVERML